MSDQHSPQEREIERFDWVPGAMTGEWVKFEDHQAALQDREAEQKKERDEALVAWAEQRDRANRAEAALREAESKIRLLRERSGPKAVEALRETREELLRRATNCTADAEGHHGDEQDVPEGEAHAYREAARTLDTSIGDREPEKQQRVVSEKCDRCGGDGMVPTGECKASMSGPTCMYANCPPCQWPETEPCPDCKPPAPEHCTCAYKADHPSFRHHLQCPFYGDGTKSPAPCSDRPEPCRRCGLYPDGTVSEPLSSDRETERWPDEGLMHPPLKNQQTVRATLRPQPEPSSSDQEGEGRLLHDRWVNAIIEFTIPLDVSPDASNGEMRDAVRGCFEKRFGEVASNAVATLHVETVSEVHRRDG